MSGLGINDGFPRYIRIVSVFVLLVAGWPWSGAFSQTREERSDLEKLFEDHGVSGAFVALDPIVRKFTVINPQRAQKRWVRCHSRQPLAVAASAASSSPSSPMIERRSMNL